MVNCVDMISTTMSLCLFDRAGCYKDVYDASSVSVNSSASEVSARRKLVHGL